jgi:hypothetical protein
MSEIRPTTSNFEQEIGQLLSKLSISQESFEKRLKISFQIESIGQLSSGQAFIVLQDLRQKFSDYEAQVELEIKPTTPEIEIEPESSSEPPPPPMEKDKPLYHYRPLDPLQVQEEYRFCPNCGRTLEFQISEKYVLMDCPKEHYCGIMPASWLDK